MASQSYIRRASIPNGFAGLRSLILGLARAAAIGCWSLTNAAPIGLLDLHDNVPEAKSRGAWPLFVASIVLVLLGGAFAGLTIALMGQDGIYLQVLAEDANDSQSKNANRVLRLLRRGKHWVLVTLLLSNVIVNESLPVVLDRCLGGGIAAVVGSTVLIVIFGEVLPQSVCVRYGLPIGAYMSYPVLLLMYLMAPVAWPTAKLLDWLLGEDHGTVYKKSGLKTLVGLHQSLGEAHERLNEDEVTIIRAVLDLKEKPVGTVMTPMEDVFVMSEDAVLDEKTMDRILSEGYSRVPIHASGSPTNFVGMLLVKILITYDPEDGKLVKEFPLATLPETRPETSCLDIVNFFQEGKSHMVLVSESPGDDHGAIGVVTLEDVIEELIGEEIIDESDVYVDVHKAIRRLTPAPKARSPKANSTSSVLPDAPEDQTPRISLSPLSAMPDAVVLSSSPKTTTFLMRRASEDPNGGDLEPIAVKANLDDMKRQLKHLGPSNPAANPKNTRSTAVKVKHGLGSASTQLLSPHPPQMARSASAMAEMVSRHPNGADEETETTPLLTSKWTTGKGGVQAIRRSYGAGGRSRTKSRLSSHTGTPDPESDRDSENHTAAPAAATVAMTSDAGLPPIMTATIASPSPVLASPPMSPPSPSSHKSNGSLSSARYRSATSHAISGGLTENVIVTGDVQKIVIQANSSSDDDNGDSPVGQLAKQSSWASISRHAIPEATVADAGESVGGESSTGGKGEDDSPGPSVPAGEFVGSSDGQLSELKNKKKNRKKKKKGHFA